ncbi:DNA polymerase IV [Gilvimarinus sp. DA14]|uniref:DNA polymerase IV n=1 Tax=Gilvimarinus sp. DA14 TaxID=2956798 RepID=UPI0020B746A5|nr:DNA polymerase IV [Gilvimarinus sp. DA14]UTF59629.1 DNA polymerase IV [Gilvimarinus sp. DA14]
MSRQIIHIDADCFFAAVEMRERPELVHRPIAIGGSASARGVISTCNYPAREFGVRSAMATARALRLCPGLILLPHRLDLYREVSASMMSIFRRYTDLLEPLSVDEAYLDVSASATDEQQALDVARKIRRDVARELQITVSAGVAGNKFLAKVASDWRKPDGLFQVSHVDTDKFVADLSVRLIPGVGRVTCEQLQYLGVIYCRDLYRYSIDELQTMFGRFGARLYWFSRGIDEREVTPERERKSVSVEQTFAEDLASKEACYDKLYELWPRLQRRLDKIDQEAAVAKGFVKVKFADFTQTTVERPGTQWGPEAMRPLLTEALARGHQKVRLLGLGVRLEQSPASDTPDQIGLFDT